MSPRDVINVTLYSARKSPRNGTRTMMKKNNGKQQWWWTTKTFGSITWILTTDSPLITHTQTTLDQATWKVRSMKHYYETKTKNRRPYATDCSLTATIRSDPNPGRPFRRSSRYSFPIAAFTGTNSPTGNNDDRGRTDKRLMNCGLLARPSPTRKHEMMPRIMETSETHR